MRNPEYMTDEHIENSIDFYMEKVEQYKSYVQRLCDEKDKRKKVRPRQRKEVERRLSAIEGELRKLRDFMLSTL